MMTVQLTFYENDLDELRRKFEIENEEDLSAAVWECISTYMEL
jgi:hypothetical protein